MQSQATRTRHTADPAEGDETKPQRPLLPISERRALSFPEAQAYTGLSRATLYRLADAHKVTRLKIGRKALLDRASLDRLLDNSTQHAG